MNYLKKSGGEALLDRKVVQQYLSQKDQCDPELGLFMLQRIGDFEQLNKLLIEDFTALISDQQSSVEKINDYIDTCLKQYLTQKLNE